MRPSNSASIPFFTLIISNYASLRCIYMVDRVASLDFNQACYTKFVAVLAIL